MHRIRSPIPFGVSEREVVRTVSRSPSPLARESTLFWHRADPIAVAVAHHSNAPLARALALQVVRLPPFLSTRAPPPGPRATYLRTPNEREGGRRRMNLVKREILLLRHVPRSKGANTCDVSNMFAFQSHTYRAGCTLLKRTLLSQKFSTGMW